MKTKGKITIGELAKKDRENHDLRIKKAYNCIHNNIPYLKPQKEHIRDKLRKIGFKEIKNRSVKILVLEFCLNLKHQKFIEKILKQYKEANNQTDKLVAFALYIDSTAKDRLDI